MFVLRAHNFSCYVYCIVKHFLLCLFILLQECSEETKLRWRSTRSSLNQSSSRTMRVSFLTVQILTTVSAPLALKITSLIATHHPYSYPRHTMFKRTQAEQSSRCSSLTCTQRCEGRQSNDRDVRSGRLLLVRSSLSGNNWTVGSVMMWGRADSECPTACRGFVRPPIVFPGSWTRTVAQLRETLRWTGYVNYCYRPILWMVGRYSNAPDIQGKCMS